MPATPTFPTARFAFDEQEIDLERRTISGGQALSGEEDLVETDGGGRWFAEFGNGPLLEREDNLAWRAIMTRHGSGTDPIIVPFCDPLHQPYATGREQDLAYADVPACTFAAGAALRATTANLDLVLPQDLQPGQVFTVEHPTKGARAYRIHTIADDGTTVSFSPPLREAVTAGDAADFLEPRCLMRVDGRPPQKLEIGRFGEASVRFVEAS